MRFVASAGRWSCDGQEIGSKLVLEASQHEGQTASLGRYRYTASGGVWRLFGRWPAGPVLRVSGALHRVVELRLTPTAQAVAAA